VRCCGKSHRRCGETEGESRHPQLALKFKTKNPRLWQNSAAGDFF
jgi:hypothetical protein